MKEIHTLETTHLIARKINSEDFTLLYKMNQNTKVMATLGGIRSKDETRKNLEWNLAQWQQNGIGLWFWFEKTTKRFVGRAGLRQVKVDDTEEVEVAYALMPEYWRKGLATEIAQACVEVAFEILKLTKLVCFTLPTNKASQRVMEKLGFQYSKSITHAGLSHVLYELKANKYWEKAISFRPLAERDLTLLVYWLNKPHVQRWWDDHLTDAELRVKYGNRIGDQVVMPFIVYLHDKPIGFIQYYYANQVGHGWWPEEIEGSVGIDQFIGEEDYLNQGYGTWLIRNFINKLLKNPAIHKVITDVDPDNHRAIRCYEKAGFKLIKEIQTPDGLALLMEVKK